MADHEAAPGSPALLDAEEPSGNNDPGDPLNPSDEEEARPNPPVGAPEADVDTFEDQDEPDGQAKVNDAGEAGEIDESHDNAMAAGSEDGEATMDGQADGDDSELDELDEKEFEDFDPSALEIPDKPVAVDDSNVGLLGVHKRKRAEGEEGERKKKKKEGRREKPKRSKKKADADGDEFGEGDGDVVDGKRARKSGKGVGEGRKAPPVRRARTPEDESNLDPDERRRRELDRKMDAALKTNRPSRRKGGIDLEAAADAEIEMTRQRMAKACEADADARDRGDVATHKLKLLPEVVELLNRNTIQAQIVDPDINLLEAVRFMLEPANHDAALPNYQIQRELFAILGKLSIGKEALIASGIGKVVHFYTKSIQPQLEIRRQAEKLMAEWQRIVLNKRKDMRSLPIQTVDYDPTLAAQNSTARQISSSQNVAAVAAERRKKALAQPVPANRAQRMEGGLGTYTVAPLSNLSNAQGQARRAGQAGEEAFRKLAARGAARAAGKK